MGTQIKSAAPTEVDFNQAKAEIAAAKKPIQEEKSAVETLYALPDQSKFSSLSEDIKEFLESCGPGE